MTIGVVAGYRGGWLDTVFMRVVDVMFAFPVLLLALAVVAILGRSDNDDPGDRYRVHADLCPRCPCRAPRASAWNRSFRRHAPWAPATCTCWGDTSCPHAGPLVVQTSLSLAFAILSEAALSFLGLGIPPQPSLGRMIFDSQGFVTLAWWMAVFPGAAIVVTVLAFNLLGDGLRDVLDPKQRTMIEARRRSG